MTLTHIFVTVDEEYKIHINRVAHDSVEYFTNLLERRSKIFNTEH